VIGQIVWVNRRTGVVHYDGACPSLEDTWPGMLRRERFDRSLPRRRCSRCWPTPEPSPADLR
jgi:hypothetical protein